MKSFVYIIIFALVMYFLVAHSPKNHNPDDIKYVNIAGANIEVELALSEEAQIKGLSNRISLGENEGMLFVFSVPGKYFFWMKDMNFPIDMIWIGENLRVIYIKQNVQPESYPAVFGPEDNARYVLEVASGFSKKHNLKKGDVIRFTPTPN